MEQHILKLKYLGMVGQIIQPKNKKKAEEQKELIPGEELLILGEELGQIQNSLMLILG